MNDVLEKNKNILLNNEVKRPTSQLNKNKFIKEYKKYAFLLIFFPLARRCQTDSIHSTYFISYFANSYSKMWKSTHGHAWNRKRENK